MYSSSNHITLLYEAWILYLRKSRQDDPNETVAEVLAKHETQLQEYAMREFGGKIPEENIYREIVSGESIDDREEIKKVLARLEDPNIKGVLVMEPSRLSRGDLGDCAKIINAFRFSKSQIATPYMTYDLENKMERKFFKDELLRGNDYLEYTKEILLRGRVAAVKRGCYIGNYAPYGYEKVKIGKDFTLAIVEDEADIVRLIFQWYAYEGVTVGRIANRLNEMGVQAPRGEKWSKDSIRCIVRNAHYIGKVVFGRFKMTQVLEDGEIITKRLKQTEENTLICEGKQPAIIDLETWNAARNIIANNPNTRYDKPLRNPYAAMFVCGKCGRAMYIHPYKHAEDRFECKSSGNGPRCYKSTKVSEVHAAVLHALENSVLPDLEHKLKSDDGNALKIQQRILSKLEKQMQEYRAQEEKQFELLETGKYSQELFDRRNAVLRTRIKECEEQIAQAKAKMPKSVDYAERISSLKIAIEKLRDPLVPIHEQNLYLKRVVKKIVFIGSPPADRRPGKFVTNVNPFTLDVQLRL